MRGIHHISLSVSDVDRSLAFYEAATTIGAVVLSPDDPSTAGRASLGHAPRRSAVLEGPNAYLELLEFDPSVRPRSTTMPVEGPGVTHVCYQCPAPRELYRRFQSLGATRVTRGPDPIDLGGYGVHYAYARDADSLMFEVEQLDEPRFDGPIWIAHVALVTHDIDRLVAFYTELLGVEPYRRADEVRGRRADEVTGIDGVAMRAAWFDAGNMVLELWQYLHPATGVRREPPAPEAIGYRSFTFEVDDLDREIRRLTDLGADLRAEPVSDPAGGPASTEVFVRDPDQNLFGLLELEADAERSLTRMVRRTP